ncbi:hypothetical protein EI42_05679 [Thermosporothrix hazakensis]|jgi:hypothetical protein|uniref:Helix-turn-helix protein n=1 Tax=Thermosporothrix hazakensis TaxID=644383 RepID=A0A326TXL6_THEHA|nr:hypothetical protein [Thermosporothrix hazakensis]PZW21143.1 hypothetical protein EI42_05679 [Thermosporothrix hazakensis]GCE50689.1 hypothetical protein KTH_55580 [Thermosporothrix hazakensis]
MRTYTADITNRETQPLSRKAVQRSQITHYMKRHRLSIHTVAFVAGVPLMVVWRVQQGEPITKEHAHTIRFAFLCLTGVPYKGIFAVYPEERKGTR